MSEYDRTTRECPVSQLQPELLRAIQSYFQEHKLGSLEGEAQLCCETVSTWKKAGKRGSWLSGTPDTTIHTGMLLTSEQLIWVQHGDRSGTVLNAASLKQIRAGFYTSPLTKDVGLEIAGYVGDGKDYMRGYIGMGAGPVAEKFCEEVSQAIAKLNPPVKRSFFDWLRR